MSITNKEDIARHGGEKLKQELQSLIDEIDARTSDPDHFLTISELEKLWSSASASTSKIYSNILSEAISNIDEKELIKSKKESSNERGSS